MTDIAKTRASFGAEGSFTPDNLIAGCAQTHCIKATIVSGAGARKRGDLLGKVTASGKYKLSLSGASDGSEVPRVILAEDVDATSADKEAMIYLSGEFNSNAITLGTGHTIASVTEGLRDLNIYLHAPVKIDGSGL